MEYTTCFSPREGGQLEDCLYFKILFKFRMLRIITIFFLSILIPKVSLSEDFEVFPLNIKFYGSISINGNVIAYGDKGAYLISTDKGQTWEQNSTQDYGKIYKIVLKDGIPWGIIDNGIIIRSPDGGKSWEYRQHELEEYDAFISIAAGDNYIYIRTLKKILCFNYKLEFINEYSDSNLQEVSYSPITNILIQKPFEFINNNLILPSSWNEPEDVYEKILILDDTLGFKDTLSLNLLMECNDCKIRNIQNYHGKPLLKIYNKVEFDTGEIDTYNLYFLENFKKLELLIESNKEELKYEIIKNSSIIGDDIFSVAFFDGKVDSVLFFKIDNSGKRFIPFGNSLNMDTYNLQVDNHNTNRDYFRDIIKNYTSELIGNPLFTNNLLVKAGENSIHLIGSDKTIISTTDKGNNWEVRSMYPGTYYDIINTEPGEPVFMINDYRYYVSNAGVIMSITNSGTTFQPIHSNENIGNDYKGFISTPIFYVNSDGEGFFTGPKDGFTQIDSLQTILIDNNFAYSSDFGKSFEFISLLLNQVVVGTKDISYSNVLDTEGNYIFATFVDNSYSSYLHKIKTDYQNISN